MTFSCPFEGRGPRVGGGLTPKSICEVGSGGGGLSAMCRRDAFEHPSFWGEE